MLSLNELHALVIKASVGAGLPVGNAQEVAAAAVWLGQRDMPACEIVANALARACEPSGRVHDGDTGMIWDEAVAVRDGPAAIDLLFATESSNFEIVLNRVDEPKLLLGLVGAAAERHQSPVSFKADTVQVVVGIDGPVDRDSARAMAPGKCVLSRTNAEIAPSVRVIHARYDPAAAFDEGIDHLAQLAARTYVPSSASSRAGGAGAGLTDND